MRIEPVEFVDAGDRKAVDAQDVAGCLVHHRELTVCLGDDDPFAQPLEQSVELLAARHPRPLRSYGTRGTRKENRTPAPFTFSAQIRPPWALTIPAAA